MTGGGANAREGDPNRALAATIVMDALGCLHGNLRGRAHIQRSERGLTREERVMARRFFTRRDPRAVPFNFRFCCDVLNLDLEAVRARVMAGVPPIRARASGRTKETCR